MPPQAKPQGRKWPQLDHLVMDCWPKAPIFVVFLTMCRDSFHEKSLFHFKPSEVTFEGILSFMWGCLQARQVFIFPRNTTRPKNGPAENKNMTTNRKNDKHIRKLSSLLGCLQARHPFLFPRNTTWPKKRAVLAVSTGHILMFRCKACALLRAKTSALLRRKTCAVLRARTCLASQQGRCLGFQQGTCLASQH